MVVSQTGGLAGGDGVSLAELATRIDADAGLDDVRRGRFLGAIRTVCKVLVRPAEAISAEPGEIERLLNQVPIPARRVSRKTIANLRSSLKAALRHYQQIPRIPPRGTPLTPEWQSLGARLVDKQLRHGLSRLINVASYRGILPAQVNDAFVEDLVHDVVVDGDRRRLRRMIVRSWNQASASIEGWPQFTLTPPATRRQHHQSLSRFPASFRDDLEAYLRWAEATDPLATDAPNNRLKPSTLRLRREQLRVAASTLAKVLGNTDSVTNLATLVVPENTKLILNAYLDTAKNREPTTFIRGLALTLVSVARHWVKVPDEVLGELLRMKRRLKSAPRGLTDKNRHTVRQFSDPVLLRELLNLPEALRTEVRTRRLSPARRLQKIQIALAIDLLLVAPMRLRNLISLRVGTQLQWPSGRTGPVFISLLAGETKNAQPLEYPVEGQARESLHDYLDRYRAYAKVGPRSDLLFVHLDGTPVPASALRDGITKATRRELGIAVTPHQFRHIAAAVALDVHPGAIAMVADLLGHLNIKTTQNFYAGLRTREAAREWARILETKRPSIGSD